MRMSDSLFPPGIYRIGDIATLFPTRDEKRHYKTYLQEGRRHAGDGDFGIAGSTFLSFDGGEYRDTDDRRYVITDGSHLGCYRLPNGRKGRDRIGQKAEPYHLVDFPEPFHIEQTQINSRWWKVSFGSLVVFYVMNVH